MNDAGVDSAATAEPITLTVGSELDTKARNTGIVTSAAEMKGTVGSTTGR